MPYKDKKKQRAYHARIKRERPEIYRRWDMANPEARKKHRKNWAMSNRQAKNEIDRRAKMKATYGISVVEYDRMLVEQNGVCTICRRPETNTLNGKVRRLSVDHCHKTDQIRGLLCAHCNRMLGMANDDPAILRAAADYLERHS
jgi:Recombination endonuclease VII